MNSFENWVLKNFVGVEMFDPPTDWDRETEFFYSIEGKQFRIPIARVPKRFLSSLKFAIKATSRP